MGRAAVLWGTRETEYCELGRSAGLEELLRRLGAVNPQLAIEETRRMLAGCRPASEAAEGQETGTLRYGPVHLYKRQEILKNMESFRALCVSGPEEGSGRESFFTHLTFFDRGELHAPEGELPAWPDRLFGTPLMTAAAEKKIREGGKAAELAPQPVGISEEIREEEKELLSLIVTALYQDVNCRVIVRMRETEHFRKDALLLLAKACSLLPEKMAEETGFSIGEQPADIREQIDKANTKIFLLRAGSAPEPEKDFPENHVFLDLASDRELPQNYDTEMAKAVRRWEDLNREQRRSAMAVYLADEGQYFRREYYLEGSSRFFDHSFWTWKDRADLRFDPGDAKGLDAQYREVKELYKAYTQFDICRNVDWVREEFVKRIPDFLAEGESIATLRQAVVRKAVEAGEKNPNTVENCRGYRKWLDSLLAGTENGAEDDAFECARLAAEDAKQSAAAVQNEALEAKLLEKDEVIRAREAEIREREAVIADREEKIAAGQQQLQAAKDEMADKEAQWGAFLDSLEQQMGKQTVDEIETATARKINPAAAEQVDALSLELMEARELNGDFREEIRRLKEQLEHEKRSGSRSRAQTGEVIRRLKFAMIGVLVVGLLLGLIIGIRLF